MGLVRTKTFNGKKFRYEQTFTNKTDAKEYACGLRDGGYNARVIKVKRHYEVWMHYKGLRWLEK